MTSIDSSSIFQPLVRCGPAVAEDVLVQVLPCSDTEEEAAGHHRRRRGLRDDRGVDSHQRAGHPVPSRSASVSRAIPAITLQTNGLCPWRSIHGWM